MELIATEGFTESSSRGPLMGYSFCLGCSGWPWAMVARQLATAFLLPVFVSLEMFWLSGDKDQVHSLCPRTNKLCEQNNIDV